MTRPQQHRAYRAAPIRGAMVARRVARAHPGEHRAHRARPRTERALVVASAALALGGCTKAQVNAVGWVALLLPPIMVVAVAWLASHTDWVTGRATHRRQAAAGGDGDGGVSAPGFDSGGGHGHGDDASGACGDGGGGDGGGCD